MKELRNLQPPNYNSLVAWGVGDGDFLGTAC